MEYIRRIFGENKYQRGPTRWEQPTWARQGAQARPGGLCSRRPTSGAHLLDISHFDLEKIREYFRDEAPLSRGRTWARALLPSGGVILPGELPSRRGKSSSSSSPTTLPSWGGQYPSTSSIARSPLKPQFISCVQSLYRNYRSVLVGDQQC